MMTNTNITNLRKNLFDYIDLAVTYNDVISVNTKNGNAIILSEDDYRGLVEVIYVRCVAADSNYIRGAGRTLGNTKLFGRCGSAANSLLGSAKSGTSVLEQYNGL